MSDLSFSEDYVRRLVNGDFEVERHFTTHFGALLRVKLRTKLRSPQLIDDVRQDTFLRVLQSLRKENGLQKPERLGAFVNAVCNNVMLEAFRSSSRHPPLPDDAPAIMDEAENPSQNLITHERQQVVRDILAQLGQRDSELLRQVFFEERDKTLICKEMNVNAEYLRVLIHRAKMRFKAALESKAGERH